MTRYEFINELKERLRKLPYDEVNEAVEYYEQYFDDAGAQNESTAIAELGTPGSVASQIIAEYAIKDADRSKTSAKRGLSTVFSVILAIFAAPIALPLAMAAIIIAFAIVFSLGAVLFAFGISGAACIAAGIVSVVVGVAVIIQDFATALSCAGIGLVSFGIGLIMIKAVAALSKKCFGWFAKLIGKFILRRSGK